MGRTGRKRDGYIVALVTDGKEHEVIILFKNRVSSEPGMRENPWNLFQSGKPREFFCKTRNIFITLKSLCIL